MKAAFTLVFLFSTLAVSFASNEKAQGYIEKYKDIAISEMKRSGIPASIKLAQGMLESQWGESELARKANNHFGIKCGSQWSGPTFFRADDDFDSRGKQVESCFRAYDDARTSYISHTDFLTEPKKQSRYGFLFSFASDDYNSWAKGLSQAGYATDPKYADKLISTIQRYNLSIYDERLSGKELANNQLPDARNQTNSGGSFTAASESRYHHQGLKHMITDGKSSAEDISKHFGLSLRHLLSYNETILIPSEDLPAGEIVYLEPKLREYAGTESVHYVREGETVASISQLYGLRAVSLRSINKIARDEDVKPGQVIYLTVKARNNQPSKPERIRTDSKKKKKSIYLLEWK